jgi:DNA-binding GntR family transcriptional regulator
MAVRGLPSVPNWRARPYIDSVMSYLSSAGGNPSTTTEKALVRPPTPAERRSLALAPRAHVVELRRTRWLDYEPVGVGTSVLPAALVPGLPEKVGPDGRGAERIP